MSIRDEAMAEAKRLWPSYPTIGFSGAGDRQAAFVSGAEWQASREHTEEEVEALVDDIIHWDDTTATDGPCDGTWESLAAHLIRRGWTRTTRRDEETDR